MMNLNDLLGGEPQQGGIFKSLLTVNSQQAHGTSRLQGESPTEISNIEQIISYLSFSQNWNPIKARSSCFQQVLPLVKDLLTGEKKETVAGSILAANDRLLQLIIKGRELDLSVYLFHHSCPGILYESCVDYCQQKATASKNSNSIEFTNILSESEFSDSDLSLLSWLQVFIIQDFIYHLHHWHPSVFIPGHILLSL